MVAMTFSPPYTSLKQLNAQMQAHGYAVLPAADVAALAHASLQHLQTIVPSWNALPPDTYLKDGGRYRFRRHSCFVVEDGDVQRTPHRAHWQSLEYNALHGGMQRLFEPIADSTLANRAWHHLLLGLGRVCTQQHGKTKWHVEAHQFRIDTSDGIGRPTPEGAHRDGVDYVAVILIARQAIKGGETRVFQADGPQGQRFTLIEPWSMLLLDDARMIHETTPIQPSGEYGYRDTLVLTYRQRAFQGDD